MIQTCSPAIMPQPKRLPLFSLWRLFGARCDTSIWPERRDPTVEEVFRAREQLGINEVFDIEVLHHCGDSLGARRRFPLLRVVNNNHLFILHFNLWLGTRTSTCPDHLTLSGLGLNLGLDSVIGRHLVVRSGRGIITIISKERIKQSVKSNFWLTLEGERRIP
ncbi:uncharacterized protein DS421_11g341430 [Arachis hypogaea]|nr:uncharacterized protein DS421_11g341430 [Arachis hypogaea]